MRSRRGSVPRPAPAPPRPPTVPRCAWPEAESNHPWVALLGLAEILEKPYQLPSFQRGLVWSPSKRLALCEAIWMHRPIAPLVIWERSVAGERRFLLVDGQQRLSALGASIVRADGEVVHVDAPQLDLETGRWQLGPVAGQPLTTTYALLDGDRWLDGFDTPELDRVRRLAWRANARLTQTRFAVYQLPSTLSRDQVVAFFRSWNTPGVLLTPEEVDQLVDTNMEE